MAGLSKQLAGAAGMTVGGYSITTPCSRMTLAQRGISDLMNCANSSGALAIDSNICGAMMRCWNAGSARIFRTSALIFITTSRGVPPGAARPNQVLASEPGTVAAIVGTFGRAGDRVVPPTQTP